MKQLIIVLLTILFTILIVSESPTLAADTVNGAEIFGVNCAGCHPQGGNIIRRGKNLQKRALEKYKMDSQEAISYLVANGKNNMSAFKDRLSEEEINAVAGYVLEQAATGWLQTK